jgi:hypothetical protein
MLRSLVLAAVAGLALAAATSAQATPVPGALSLTKAQSTMQQAHWRHHRHWRGYRAYRGHRGCGWF